MSYKQEYSVENINNNNIKKNNKKLYFRTQKEIHKI